VAAPRLKDAGLPMARMRQAYTGGRATAWNCGSTSSLHLPTCSCPLSSPHCTLITSLIVPRVLPCSFPAPLACRHGCDGAPAVPALPPGARRPVRCVRGAEGGGGCNSTAAAAACAGNQSALMSKSSAGLPTQPALMTRNTQPPPACPCLPAPPPPAPPALHPAPCLQSTTCWCMSAFTCLACLPH
jgi:hypothetical protein